MYVLPELFHNLWCRLDILQAQGIMPAREAPSRETAPSRKRAASSVDEMTSPKSAVAGSSDAHSKLLIVYRNDYFDCGLFRIKESKNESRSFRGLRRRSTSGERRYKLGLYLC